MPKLSKKQKGQVILGLILVMVVALGIGLSIVQKSLVDVSTSTKVEQSSRAFSAAEAGIEKALNGDSNKPLNFGDNTSSIKEITDSKLIPCVPGDSGPPPCSQPDGNQQSALEYPPLAKEDVAHVWLANFDSTDNPPTEFYKQNSLDVYWGNSSFLTDNAALELTLVFYGTDPTDDPLTSKYRSRKWYLDNPSAKRASNGFEGVSTCSGYPIGSNGVTYQCKKKLDLPSGKLMLLRARLLYNTNSQPFAVQAPVPCSLANGCFIPPQARNLTSTGASGETQRSVKLFQIKKVVPSYFDYAIFSTLQISKND